MIRLGFDLESIKILRLFARLAKEDVIDILGLYEWQVRQRTILSWEQYRKNINAVLYTKRILPLVQRYIDPHPGLVCQEDNAAPHAPA